ncbi:primosomal protein N' family DNA-binding protein [Actinomyces culturomici]|uniref:primosomal protein N' family DNA-binding protein n=1 Tax=Actinomyces culturomici TaxID=1926276 RepID=UPI000E2047C9|nr:primosomal protein N' [Actinomyces culturomici]
MDEQTTLDGFAPGDAPVRVAGVLVDVDLAHLDRPLDYEVPTELLGAVAPGVLVRVRLAGRRLPGWVVDVRTETPVHRLSPIETVVSALPVLSPQILQVARRIADRNVATASQALSLAIPARHAATEKAVLAADPAHPSPCAPPEGAAWATHPAGPALLAHLGAGEGPRAVWTQLGPTRDARIVELVRATRSSGRSALVVAPTTTIASRLHELLAADLDEQIGLVTAESSPADRYRIHLEALLGRLGIVVGTRSAVWTPMTDLGLVLVEDDGDDRLRERRAPRCDALDVAVARAHIEGCALVAGAHSRSVKAQELVASHWAVDLTEDVPVRRALGPLVRVLDDADADAEGPGGAMRMPGAALRAIREGLETGPVLVQVASSGYVPVVSCARCRAIARCAECGGPLRMAASGAVSCAWCARPVQEWRCRQCSGTRLRSVRVGSERTAEEIARTIHETSVLVSSSSHAITRTIGAEARIVVATPGAEPAAEGGYAALVILDARAVAGRAELWAPEEAMRRWFNALALVRPGGAALFSGGVETAMAQALIRLDPADFAQRLLDERAALGYFPAKTVVALDGAPGDVAALAGGAEGELIGTVPLEDSEGSGRVRALVRADRGETARLLDSLAQAQQQRAARKLAPVRITVNPPELF